MGLGDPSGPRDEDDELSELGLGGRVRIERAVRAGRPWLFSAVAHAAALVVVAVYAGRSALVGAPVMVLERTTDAAIESAQRPLIANSKRLALIREARQQRADGNLRLGDFLLRANAIDAEEDGVPFDLESARSLYRARVRDMRKSLAANPPEVAVPEVFGDLTYTGTPGGRMGDTLFMRRGSCEPVSHLVAATLYDAGLRARSRLRFYGGSLSGVTHLTPVLTVTAASGQDEEIDLMTGARSEPGGATFQAGELVEAYARVHHLIWEHDATSAARAGVARRPPAAGLVSDGMVPATRTLTQGYPANGDRFAGSLPLFAEQAITAGDRRADEDSAGSTRPEPPPCSFYLPLAWLDLPHAQVLGPSAGVDVDLVRAPSMVELERLSTIILDAESHPPGDAVAPRLLASACLAALYDHAGLAFSLAGQSDVSRRAVFSAKRERDKGTAALKELGAMSAADRKRELSKLDEIAFGRSWILLFLDGGEEAVASIAEDPDIRYGRTMAITAMLVAPRTRKRGVLLADALPIKSQVDLMHELTHAHDNARPWASSYALDLSRSPEVADTAFARNYRVFYALAWRLWDAARSPEETVEALDREATNAGLDDAARRAIGLYYLKHVARLYRPREGGTDVIARAGAALQKAGFAGLSELGEEEDLPLPVAPASR